MAEIASRTVGRGGGVSRVPPKNNDRYMCVFIYFLKRLEDRKKRMFKAKDGIAETKDGVVRDSAS